MFPIGVGGRLTLCYFFDTEERQDSAEKSAFAPFLTTKYEYDYDDEYDDDVLLSTVYCTCSCTVVRLPTTTTAS